MKRLLYLFILILVSGLIAKVIIYPFLPPSIPHCTNASDVVVGNGEYDKQTGYWSEYDCVSDWRRCSED